MHRSTANAESPGRESVLADYMELTKPRIVTLVLVTGAIGYYLAAGSIHPLSLFLILMAGTALSAAGASVLNHYLERDSDARMKRTRQRPLPSGRIPAAHALAFGILLTLSGTVLLVWQVNLLTGFLSLLTNFLYVLVYTPLKRVTWVNTFIGAIPGALPPMGGWTAATNEIGLGAWILFLILFVWQHPHFYSIAWMYREDYERGGLKMLPVVEPDGASTFRQIVQYSILLLPVSVLPTLAGITGNIYLFGALALGLWMLAVGLRLRRTRLGTDARHLLHVSVVYLPILLILIVVDAGV